MTSRRPTKTPWLASLSAAELRVVFARARLRARRRERALSSRPSLPAGKRAA